VLPAGVGAAIRRGTWPVPPIFELLVSEGDFGVGDAFHAFNMGLGMLVVVPADQADAALGALPEACLVGELVSGEGVALV
jgi:phosphoribosylformylglycinamidine cyclo-ligase